MTVSTFDQADEDTTLGLLDVKNKTSQILQGGATLSTLLLQV